MTPSYTLRPAHVRLARQSEFRTASAAACLTWERLFVSVRWHPPRSVAIVTDLGSFRFGHLMQTTGVCGGWPTVERCQATRTPTEVPKLGTRSEPFRIARPFSR